MSSRGEVGMHASLQKTASEEALETAGAVAKQEQRQQRPFKVFISLRFGEALKPSQLLKRALEQQFGVEVFLCDVEPGGDISEKIIDELEVCDLVIIMGTKTYGQRTASNFSTFNELRFIINDKIPFFLIKMCERFEAAKTRFRLPDDISYFLWMTEGVPSEQQQQQQLPSELVPKIMDKLRSVDIRSEPRRLPQKPQLSQALCAWLERYELLYSVGSALEKLGITDVPTLEAATETFRNTKARVKAKIRAMEEKRRKRRKGGKNGKKREEGEGMDGNEQQHQQPPLLLEDTLRKEKIRAAEIGRFVRACRLSTWRHEVEKGDRATVGDTREMAEREHREDREGNEAEAQLHQNGHVGKGAEEGAGKESDGLEPETSGQAPPRREGVADEEVFWESLEQVEDEEHKEKILNVWNNTCGEEVEIYGGFGAAGLRALAEALKANTTLKKLDLASNDIGDKGARGIGEALKANSTLTTLSLGNNEIRDEGARGIGEALKANSTLMSLDLGNNEIRDEGARGIGEALKANSTLMNLDLNMNNIGDEGARGIGEALKANTRLTNLDLNLNNIADAGAHVLLGALASNTMLTGIAIYDNSLSDRLESQIDDAVRRNKRRQEELEALLRFGSVPLSTAKVFVCGDYGIGKTTLIRTLRSSRSRVGAALRNWRGHKDNPDKASERTPGIQVHRMRVKRSSTFSFPQPSSTSSSATTSKRPSKTMSRKCDLRVYDFAGQLEYHVVHELLLADYNAVFVVCVDLTKPYDVVHARVVHWLSFIKTRLHQAPVRSAEPPQVIVIGTKADKPHREHRFARSSEGVTTFVQGDALVQSVDLKMRFGDSMRIHPHLLPLKCHESRGTNMQWLRDLLHNTWADVVQRDFHVPKVVEQIAEGLDACRQDHDGPWRLQSLVSRLQTTALDLKLLEYVDNETIAKALNYLHVRGDILWFFDTPSLREHVFVSPSWLLSNVVGPALAPHHFVITRLEPRDGEVSMEEIERVFGQLMDANAVVDVLCSMLLCFPLLSDEAATSVSPRYLLPSRLDPKPEHIWPKSDTAQCFGGRRFVVSRERGMIFPPGLFPRLQTRVASLLDAGTSMWRTGFSGLYGPAECFGRIEDDHTIDLWVRGLEADKEHIWLALSLMLLELEDEAERIDYEHHVLSHTHLSSYHAHPAGYPIEDVQEAIENNDTIIQRMVEVVAEDGAVTRETVTDNLNELLREGLFLPPLIRNA